MSEPTTEEREREARDIQRKLERDTRSRERFSRCACGRSTAMLVGPPGAPPEACAPICPRCFARKAMGL